MDLPANMQAQRDVEDQAIKLGQPPLEDGAGANSLKPEYRFGGCPIARKGGVSRTGHQTSG